MDAWLRQLTGKRERTKAVAAYCEEKGRKLDNAHGVTFGALAEIFPALMRSEMRLYLDCRNGSEKRGSPRYLQRYLKFREAEAAIREVYESTLTDHQLEEVERRVSERDRA